MEAEIQGLRDLVSGFRSELGDRLDVLHQDNLTENIKRDKRIRHTNIAMAACFVVGLLGIVLAVTGWWLNGLRVDDIIAVRDEARIASCQQDNAQRGRANLGLDALQRILDLAAALPPRADVDPAQRDAFFAESKALIDAARNPARDCSPQGIDQFFSTGAP